MTAPPDPRRTPYRPDLAAGFLHDRVAADRYVDGVGHTVVRGRSALTGVPGRAARRTSEVIFGDVVDVYDTRDGWAWIQNRRDGYVGWVEPSALREGHVPPTHVVADLRGFVFPEPDLKAPPLDALPLGAVCAVAGEELGYARLATGGWIYARHLRPVGPVEPDIVASAERLDGVPYLWGGCTPWGIDCSGLVQLCLRLAGVDAPRDSDMQRDELGALLSSNGADVAYRRGDLVFFPGHVGLMRDARTLVHATAFTMTVVAEPLHEVAVRAGGITAVRRVAVPAPCAPL